MRCELIFNPPVGDGHQIPIDERGCCDMTAEFGIIELSLLAARVDENGETLGGRNLIIRMLVI